MKYTQYFLYTHEHPDRQNIRLEWIERVVLQPDHEVIQADVSMTIEHAKKQADVAEFSCQMATA